MSVLRNPFWWAAVAVFILHQLAERFFGLDVPALDSYLDPFLAPPILLGFWLFERRRLYRAPRLSWFETAVASLILAVIFEEIFPKLREGFARDVVDYAFYVFGGMYFYLTINPRPASRE